MNANVGKHYSEDILENISAAFHWFYCGLGFLPFDDGDVQFVLQFVTSNLLAPLIEIKKYLMFLVY